jgi:hypothetical protein
MVPSALHERLSAKIALGRTRRPVRRAARSTGSTLSGGPSSPGSQVRKAIQVPPGDQIGFLETFSGSLDRSGLATKGRVPDDDRASGKQGVVTWTSSERETPGVG